jgi:hypothetical protein
MPAQEVRFKTDPPSPLHLNRAPVRTRSTSGSWQRAAPGRVLRGYGWVIVVALPLWSAHRPIDAKTSETVLACFGVLDGGDFSYRDSLALCLFKLRDETWGSVAVTEECKSPEAEMAEEALNL